MGGGGPSPLMCGHLEGLNIGVVPSHPSVLGEAVGSVLGVAVVAAGSILAEVRVVSAGRGGGTSRAPPLPVSDRKRSCCPVWRSV